MRRLENTEKLIKKLRYRAEPEVHDRVLGNVLQMLDKSKEKGTAKAEPNIWRIIMKSSITKLAAAAVIILAAVLSITIINKSATPAWAIEQTVEALENIQTFVISGTDRYGDESIPFKLWFRFLDRNSNSFDLRYASDKQIVVVRDTGAWRYWRETNTVKVYENITTSGSDMMRDLQTVYKMADLNPWITARVFETLKSFADDWRETYGKDEKTGRDCVFVTCSYKPLCISFWFVCDLENKLIIEGKFWRNVDREGQPECHAINFAYNEKIPDEVFDFQIPEGATVINPQEQKEANALFDSGEKLFHQQKEYPQAIKVYQQVYEKYPELNISEEALMMIGMCYGRLGQREKAIETFEKCIREYPNLKGWIETTYFYLGCAYVDTGHKDKALEAFKTCLIMGEGIREPNAFPLKPAREYIEKLESKE